MLNRYLTYYKSPTQFMVFCLLVSLSFLIAAFSIDKINSVWVGLTIEEINALKNIPETIAFKLKWTNSFMLLTMLLLPSCLFAYLAHDKPFQYLGLKKATFSYHWLWGITLLLIALPFTFLLEEWSKLIPEIGTSKSLDNQYDKMAMAMLSGKGIPNLLINIISICLLPAIIEEIFFRGCFQQILLNGMRETPFTAILIVAITFSAFHGQLSGFIPRLFLGLLLGLAYHYSGSIFITILMHFLNNLITVVLVYLSNNKITSFDMNHLPEMNLLLGICSGLCTFGFIYLFWKNKIPMPIVEMKQIDEIN